MGACVLNGFGAGPAETSQPEIIADVMFLHERGAYNTLYFTFYFGSLMVGPIIAGPMAEAVGWRSFFWLNVGVLGLLLLFQIFLFPETKWHRVHPDEVAREQQQGSTPAVDDSEPEKPVEVSQKESASVENAAERDPYLHKGRPSKKQFKLWQLDGHNVKTTLISFWIPWKLLTFPIVELAAFIVSWSASCFLTLNLTQSQAFAEPPYNFNSQTIGFFNFAILIGSAIGLATNGLLSDWVSMTATRKNKGIREPEMRLPAMIIYVAIMIVGNFVVAFGYQYKWDWRVCFLPDHSRLHLTVSDHCHHWIHGGRHPGRRPPCHLEYLCGRQLQARGRFDLRLHHRQQESLGIWLQQIHHALDHGERVYPADHAEHVSDDVVVSLCDSVLLLWEEVPRVDGQVVGAQDVGTC